MITKDKKSFYFESFESIPEFLNTINKRPANTYLEEKQSSQKTTDYFCDFSGSKSYEEASELLLKGDRDLYNEIQKLKTPTKIATEKYTNKYTAKIERSVCGIFPHVPTYLAGEPNCMINIRKTRIKNKIVDVVIETAICYAISASKIKETALYIFSGIKLLEKSGYRANIYICLTLGDDISVHSGKKICLRLKVKSSEEPFNELKLSYPLAHPSMIRRHLFRWVETIQDFNLKKFTKSYGYVNNIIHHDDLMKIARINKDKTIILSLDKLTDKTQEEILDEITKNRL